MDPLDTPEPMALLNRQDLSGPTLAPLESWVEEEPDWDEVLESAFFDTMEPAPTREIEDDEPLVVRRSPVLEWGLVLVAVSVVGGAVAIALVAGIGMASTDPVSGPSPIAVEATPPVVVDAAPTPPPVEAAVLIDFGDVRSVGESDGRGVRRRSRSARPSRTTARAVPMPKPGPVERVVDSMPAEPAPMRVDALPPAISVSALPPAE